MASLRGDSGLARAGLQFGLCFNYSATEGFVVAPKRLIQPCLPVRLIACIIGCLLTLPAAGTDIPAKSTSDQPPRKVVVGTVMQPFWGKHPGLQRRLDQLTAIVDRMEAQSEKKYGRNLVLRSYNSAGS